MRARRCHLSLNSATLATKSSSAAAGHSPSTRFSPRRRNKAATWRTSAAPPSLLSDQRLIKGAVAGSRRAPPRSVCDNNALWEQGGGRQQEGQWRELDCGNYRSRDPATLRPLPQHAPPHPHPCCSLTESCCRKRKTWSCSNFCTGDILSRATFQSSTAKQLGGGGKTFHGGRSNEQTSDLETIIFNGRSLSTFYWHYRRC